MANIFEQEHLRQELRQDLAAYFKLTPQEVRTAHLDMLTSLEAEAMMLQKYVTTRDSPYFQYALHSIVTVATRLKSKFLLDISQKLNSPTSDEELLHAINLFLQMIRNLRRIVI